MPVPPRGVELLVLPGGVGFRGLMSWTDSLAGGRAGVDSTSRNFTNISEKDCNTKVPRVCFNQG